MFRAALFTIAERWKCFHVWPTDGWTDKQNVVYSDDELSLGLKKEVENSAMLQRREPEDIILSEISQLQKDLILHDSIYTRYLA